jgi:predicted dehydrogenase
VTERDLIEQPARAIRWGIVATGGIARAVTADLITMPDAEVVAVGSRATATAEAFATDFGIPRAYGSYDELLADDGVDVVYIATPHAQHHAVAATALRRGRAVLCEKPITLTKAEAVDLERIAREQGVFLMEAMKTRCNPLMLRARDLTADGEIGEICAVQASFGNPAPFDPVHRLWATDLGGGALLDLGVYVVSVAQFLLGAPSSVMATGTLAPNGVDAEAGLLLGWPSGAHAILDCSLRAPLPRTAVVSGVSGRIEIDAPFHNPTRMVLHRTGQAPVAFEESLEGNGFLPELREVHRCVRSGELQSPLMPLDDTVAVMGVLEAALAQIGARVGRSAEPSA